MTRRINLPDATCPDCSWVWQCLPPDHLEGDELVAWVTQRTEEAGRSMAAHARVMHNNELRALKIESILKRQ